MDRYVIRGGQLGFERLQVLARSWQSTTSALFDRTGIGLGMSCLDLGCGAGDVSFELARRVGPAGHVTGLDMDTVKLSLAEQSASRAGLANLEFRAVNVYDWTEPDTFDVLYCRNLLQHLSRPVEVLRTVWDAVHAGGVGSRRGR
jgi:2-polyprenyl-3-methyl-5-hydroxy-6-metoxy-1,4-benzoquinol methylase